MQLEPVLRCSLNAAWTPSFAPRARAALCIFCYSKSHDALRSLACLLHACDGEIVALKNWGAPKKIRQGPAIILEEGPITDLEIIRKVCAGEREAYAELVRRHYANIAGLCSSMLENRSQAEDAAQEIFLKAYNSLTKFHGDSSFSTWLYRIASNHCLDALRRKSREKTQSLDALLESEGARFERLLAAPSDATMSLENADFLRRVLDSLSPEYRLILTLRELQGLSYHELAETLDCSLDSVKAKLKRARRSLEEMARHIVGSGNV